LCVRAWRHGNTIVAQLLREYGDRRSGIALLALSDRHFGIKVGWLAAPRVPAQRTADGARIDLKGPSLGYRKFMVSAG
jgi:hypothetical protein